MSTKLVHTIVQQHGVVTKAQFADDGFDRNTLTRMLDAGRIVMVHRGVYRITTSPETFESRCAAACLADPTVVVTGASAARLWEFRHVFRPNTPELLVPHHANPISKGVTVRRTNVLINEDVVQRPDGIRVASPARAWFDCATHLEDERFEMLTEHVLDQHCQMPTLWRTVRRLHSRGRPGLARVRRVLSQRSDWQRPADSGLELRVLKALQKAGVPELVRQHPIRLPSNLTIHADGALPDIKWGVEVDHVTWHGGRFAAQNDKARDRACRSIGWLIERVTDQALADDFKGEIASVVEMYHLRVAESRPSVA